MDYNLLINEVCWGYNPFTSHLQTFWDIQASGRDPYARMNSYWHKVFAKGGVVGESGQVVSA